MRKKIWLSEKPFIRHNDDAIITIPMGEISGHYYIELLDKTSKVLNTWSFHNIITDTGMDAIGSIVSGEAAELFNFMQAGAGSTTPSGTDNNLATPITGRVTYSDANGTIRLTDSSGSYYSRTLTYLFSETQANGNITELGIFTLSTGGRLVNRALVRDNLGVPTTITKTSDNQLRVFYTYRVYVPTNDVTGTIVLGATSHSFTIRPQAIDASRGWGTGAPTVSPTSAGGYSYEITQRGWGATVFYFASPSGNLVDPTGTLGTLTSQTRATTVNAQTYINGTYYRDIDAIWDTTDANFGSTGIRMIQFRGIGTGAGSTPTNWTHQLLFTPNILKTNLQRLTLRFRFGWTRSRTSE